MQKAAPGTTKRIFGYIFQYKWHVVALVQCASLIGAAAQAGSVAVPAVADRQLHSAVWSAPRTLTGCPLLRALTLMGMPLRGRHFLQLAMAVAHRRRGTGHPEEDPRRHVRPPADTADPLLRHQRARRHHEPLHQRHRHIAPGHQPIVPANVLVRGVRACGAGRRCCGCRCPSRSSCSRSP